MSKRKDEGGLGFHDLQGFNLAMLGKQGWKFISQLDAMVTRFFKAKYFPREFLEAFRGSNPSYVWHSIWSSKPLLVERNRWSIGDGSQIHVWNAA